MNPETPGTQTSEYKVSLIAAVVAFVAGAVALVHPGFHLDQATQAFIVSTAVAAITLVGTVYTFCRTHLKGQKLKADAVVSSSRAYAASNTSAVNDTANTEGGQF